VVDVLFSIEKGVAVWTPVLLLVLPGLIVMRAALSRWRLGVAGLLALQIYVIASAHVWSGGACFAQRYLSEYLVFAALPFTALVSWRPRSAWSVGIGVVCLVGVGWTLFLLRAYYAREISVFGLDRQALIDIFWWRWQAVSAWWNG